VAGSALRDDLRIWDAKTGKERFRLLGNGVMGGRRVVKFTPDSKRLIAWGDDQYLRVWDMRSGKLLAEHSTREGVEKDKWDDPFGARFEMLGLSAVAISRDCTTFVLCAHKPLRVFDVESGKERFKFEPDPNGVTAIALSPDGKRLVVAGRGKSVQSRLP